MENDLISIVVPIYNTQDYLKECIESIINQTYKNLEIILVDDGSTDNSGKICDEFAENDNRIKAYHKKNGGFSDTRNYGISKATGKFIEFVDSDDMMSPKMVEILYDKITKSDADIALCSHFVLKGSKYKQDATDGKTINYTNMNDVVINSQNDDIIYTGLEATKEFLLDDKIRAYVWNKMFKRSLFDEIRFDVGRVYEDQLITPKLFLKAKKVVYSDIPLYFYRQREGSFMQSVTTEKKLKYINVALDMNKYVLDNVKDNEIKKYTNFNISLVTLNIFNEAGLFNLYELIQHGKVNSLYNIFKNIMEDSNMENFIMNHVSNTKKIHFYFLLEEKERYVKNNKYLPIIYPEHQDLAL